jgi:glycerophosphoryl diester phosphodiesterase
MVLLEDRRLDCRTNGKGEVRAASLAEIELLDAGYGYTSDGGKTFPFRGKGVGQVTSLAKALPLLRGQPLIYRFTASDPVEADLLAAELKTAKRDPKSANDGFLGTPAQAARIKAQFPGAWAWSLESADQCTSDYKLMGWLGLTPTSCRNGTLLVPLDRQWAFAGWPNRLMTRMDAVGAKVIIVGSARQGRAFSGFDLPEQIGQVPNTFTGFLWVDDIWTIAPALFPKVNNRTQGEDDVLEKVLERRRTLSGG